MASREPQPSRVIAGGPRPWQWAVLGLLTLLLLAGGYAGGRWHVEHSLSDNDHANRQELRRQLVARERELADLRQQLTAAAVDARVEGRTLSGLEATLTRQQRTIAGLREEISIYRGLTNGTEDKGLKIRSWTVWPLPQPGRYAYRLVVQQRSAKGAEVKGSAQVQLIGVDANGTERTIPLSELSTQHTQKEIELRFSHFQALEGELTLRNGFTPERVQVTASSDGAGARQVSKRYAWAVQQVVKDDVGQG